MDVVVALLEVWDQGRRSDQAWTVPQSLALSSINDQARRPTGADAQTNSNLQGKGKEERGKENGGKEGHLAPAGLR
ncbi:hypothetical protein EG329_006974 [Mollisiaceae sp. DMI_Dod_QoI]|nr:hypothetical protein EG329_006974 [Helotiales sp. DMI_Dod_QoI]